MFGFDSTANAVGAARQRTAIDSKCAAGRQWEPLQFVFYGVGAVAAGAGAYLLYTGSQQAPAAPKTGWTVVPAVGPQGGGVSATYVW